MERDDGRKLGVLVQIIDQHRVLLEYFIGLDLQGAVNKRVDGFDKNFPNGGLATQRRATNDDEAVEPRSSVKVDHLRITAEFRVK